MTFFLILLLFLFVWYILRPAYRVWSTVRRAQRQANDFFGQRQQTYQGPFGEAYGDRTQKRRRRYPRKKIDPNVGEYVDFEELPASPSPDTQSSSSNPRFKPEQQVEDADWEEIK